MAVAITFSGACNASCCDLACARELAGCSAVSAPAGYSLSLTRRIVRSAFYDRLKEVRDAHRHFPNVLAPTREVTDAALAEEMPVEFTGEEGGGRYLDLHELFRMYTNAPFGAKTDYLTYLDGVAAFSAIPRPKKFHKSYSEYLTALSAYLLDFHRRSHPLQFIEPVLERSREAFAAAWDAGSVPGWEDRGMGHAAAPEGSLDLDVFDTAEELQTLGSEAIKDALTRLGLKAGGTEAERAARLFSTKGKRLDQLDKKLFVRGAAPATDDAASARAAAAARQIASLEAETSCLVEQLRDVIKATRGNVEKKTTLSFQELEAERMEEEYDAPEDGEVRSAASVLAYAQLTLCPAARRSPRARLFTIL